MWSNDQYVTVSGSITYSNGYTVNLNSLRITDTSFLEHLTNVWPFNANGAAYNDSPGLAMSLRDGSGRPTGVTIVSADVTWSMTVYESVSSSDFQTAECPRLEWSVTIHWRTVDGRLEVSGGGTLWR